MKRKERAERTVGKRKGEVQDEERPAREGEERRRKQGRGRKERGGKAKEVKESRE